MYKQKIKGRPLLPPGRHCTSAYEKNQKRARTSSNSSTGNYTMASLPKDTDTPRRTSVHYATARTRAHTLQENARPTKTLQSADIPRHASSYTRQYATPQRYEAHYTARTTYASSRRTQVLKTKPRKRSSPLSRPLHRRKHTQQRSHLKHRLTGWSHYHRKSKPDTVDTLMSPKTRDTTEPQRPATRNAQRPRPASRSGSYPSRPRRPYSGRDTVPPPTLSTQQEYRTHRRRTNTPSTESSAS